MPNLTLFENVSAALLPTITGTENEGSGDTETEETDVSLLPFPTLLIYH